MSQTDIFRVILTEELKKCYYEYEPVFAFGHIGGIASDGLQ